MWNAFFPTRSDIFWFLYVFAYSFFPNFPLSVPFGTTPNEQLPMNLHPFKKKNKILESPFYLAFLFFFCPHEIPWPLLPARAELCNNWPRYRPPGVDGMIRMLRWFGIDTSLVTSRRVVFSKKIQPNKTYLVGGFSPTPGLKNMRKSKWVEPSSPKNRGDFLKIFELPPSRYICNTKTQTINLSLFSQMKNNLFDRKIKAGFKVTFRPSGEH